MRSNFVILLSVLCVPGLAARVSSAEEDALARVKALYEGAAYVEALDVLARSPGEIPAAIADEYRASCLLAVGRGDEAERVLEALIAQRPDLTFEETDRSPKLMALFRSVQKRVAPAALRVRFTAAKAEFEAGRMDSASAQLKGLLATLDRVRGALDPDAAADLRTLAEGFLRLSAPVAVPSPVATGEGGGVDPVPPPVAPPPPAAVQPAKEIYDERDAEVVPPVPIDQRMPQWTPPRALQRQVFRGMLEVVIDEKGAVQSRVMREPAHTIFDPVLLNAAGRWTYYPALKDGRPVKYRKLIVVTLHGDR